jgi:hypothetical protein
MAELLPTGGWSVPGSLGVYLREMLPDEYVVVADPVVHGCAYDAIAVGPQGLAVMQVKNGELEAATGGNGGRAATSGDGRRGNGHSQPRQGPPLGQPLGPVQAFVREEFPGLHPVMRYVVAERDPEADLPTWRVVEADAMTADTLAEAITLSDQPPDPALADERMREDLAVALRDRQLTVGQRAAKPFVFRSGSLLGASAKAWTVRDVVAYMDRHPSDGIFHLCNGTLERWLLDEGAPHLAKLAHQAVIDGRNDRRRALEIFLIGAGLVARPRLALSPKQMNLGYVLDGISVSDVLRIRRGRGRGYLFGTLAAGEQWLHLSPKEFGRNTADIVVTVDTTPLLIGPEPYRADVLVTSSAGAEPEPVPVRFRVVSMPSAFSRYVLRPLVGLLLAGLLGAVVGWLFARGSTVSALELPFLGALPSMDLVWMAPVALLWAILGAARGATQPPAWPIHFAVYRWLRRTVKWAAALVVVALLATWGWGRSLGVDVTRSFYLVAALCGLAAAVLPATIGEIQTARALRNPALLTEGRRAIGSAVRGVAGVLLLLVLLSAPRFVIPAIGSPQAHEALQTAQGWGVTGMERMSAAIDDLFNQFTLRYYDRRAPAEPEAAPASIETPVPVAGGKGP